MHSSYLYRYNNIKFSTVVLYIMPFFSHVEVQSTYIRIRFQAIDSDLPGGCQMCAWGLAAAQKGPVCVRSVKSWHLKLGPKLTVGSIGEHLKHKLKREVENVEQKNCHPLSGHVVEKPLPQGRRVEIQELCQSHPAT